MEKIKEEKSFSFYRFIGKVGDILLWPVLIISLFSSFFMLVQKKQNKVTSLFGYSLVNVLSGSMIDEGFKINDTVLTKKINERDVKLGDIIAFYYRSSTKSESSVHMVEQYNYSGGREVDFSETNIVLGVDLNEYPKINDQSQEHIKEAQEKKAKVYFHRVIAIYVDDEGNMFFKTKGSNNSSADSALTRGDLIVGKYVHTPVFLRRIVSFCGSTIGMIILVCVPLSILVFMQMLSMIEQISTIKLEKRLISGQLTIYDDDIKKDLKSKDIELYNKVYLYYMASPNERQAYKKYLWSDVLNSHSVNDKSLAEYQALERSTKSLEVSDTLYWQTWINFADKRDKKKLVEYWMALNPNAKVEDLQVAQQPAVEQAQEQTSNTATQQAQKKVPQKVPAKPMPPKKNNP
ncbi:MAG: hypothetical protein E7378_01240 [Clostridiales bacterium]|nr:hypothetical protein [Clostridiales bacterium]